MAEIVFEEESDAIQGAIFEVYKELGCGFLESVYQEALALEFTRRNIIFTAQQELQIHYKGIPLQQRYRTDFICYNSIVLELKAVKSISPEHHAQIFNYLKVTGFALGLLVNFGAYPKVEIKRVFK